MSEQNLKRAFAEAVAEVSPLPSPYVRLMERRRASHWRRLAGWATGGIAAILALILGPVGLLNPAAPPNPTPSVHMTSDPDTSMVESPQQSVWGGLREASPGVRQLLDSPPRGALGQDEQWREELLNLVRRKLRQGDKAWQPRLLFADDIGNKRIAVIALTDDVGISNGMYVTGAVMLAERGASPERLAGASTGNARTDGRLWSAFDLSPYVTLTFPKLAFPPNVAWRGFLTVRLAPAGCRIATGVPARHTEWREHPTGDYLVSVADEELADRVTCGGKVKAIVHRITAETVGPATLTEADVASAAAGARGEECTAQARNLLKDLNRDPWTEDYPSVVFCARVPGIDRKVVLTRSRGWREYFHYSAYIDPDLSSSRGGVGLKQPLAATSLLAISMGEHDREPTEPVLVVGPPGTMKLEYKLDTGGWQPVAVIHGAALIEVPRGGSARVRAIGPDGRVLDENAAPMRTPVEPVTEKEPDDFQFQELEWK